MASDTEPAKCDICAGLLSALEQFYEGNEQEREDAIWVLEDYPHTFSRIAESARQGCRWCSFLSRLLLKYVQSRSPGSKNKREDDKEGKPRIKPSGPVRYEIKVNAVFKAGGNDGDRGIFLECRDLPVRNIRIRILESSDFDPISSENIARINEKMQVCTERHKLCPNFTSGKGPKRLLRLMEGDEIRLEEMEGKESKYAILSYCWGDDESVRDARTTLGNLNKRMIRFSSSDLPATIRDAVSLTRSLGIQYIWVDSICIVQEPIDLEWTTEAQKMTDYYGNAYVTIVPVMSASAVSGFKLAPTEMTWDLLPGPWSRETNAEFILAREGASEGMGNRVARHNSFWSCWNRRTWTFQEKLISSRVLYIQQDRALLSCREGDFETLGGWDPETKPSVTSFLPIDRFTKDGYSDDESSWWGFAYLFTRRELTFEKDRYFAFSGFADRYSSIFGREVILGLRRDTLLEGLVSWVPEFSLFGSSFGGLFWKLSRSPPAVTGLPSWTWMAAKWQKGSGVMMHLTYVTDLQEPRAQLESIDQPEDARLTRLQLRTAFLSSEELLGLVKLSFSDNNDREGCAPYRDNGIARFDDCDIDEVCSSEQHPPSDCMALRMLSSPSRKITACLVGLGRIGASKDDKRYWFFLLIEPVGETEPSPEQPLKYRRVGALDFTPEFSDKFDPGLGESLGTRKKQSIILV
ncbi:uncharacterized protein CTRU02_203094 [Colletotrichum truncatum]|uniref:Uncharacterized protein n=1 Tax=Colletotrichum truncatum TaxID=5467 RepID=A0ACC3Z8A5_COLTU|nr:uncharacterized protein CTRU02_08931 [Colletotrichum truncatum]KAF6789139.1 hypothetical protein CTRU02_08931 [Colletotrichum truncatum]